MFRLLEKFLIFFLLDLFEFFFGCFEFLLEIFMIFLIFSDFLTKLDFWKRIQSLAKDSQEVQLKVRPEGPLDF